jgi:hypothetical protein
MGRKAYATRVDFEMDGILNTDTYYTMEGIMTSLGRGGRPGLAGAAGKGYISYQLENTLVWVSSMQTIKLLWLLQGLPQFRRANYNKKTGKCLAAVTSCLL